MADELRQPTRYRADAERMKAMALTAATPEMCSEFLRLATMYEVLASRLGPGGTLNPPGLNPLGLDAPVAARE
jgi:hypothetical protein